MPAGSDLELGEESNLSRSSAAKENESNDLPYRQSGNESEIDINADDFPSNVAQMNDSGDIDGRSFNTFFTTY